MMKSMTGFSSVARDSDGFCYTLDIRSVNHRGLDVKVRVPDLIEGLEQTLRTGIAKRFSRGAFQVNLRFSQKQAADHPDQSVNINAIDTLLGALTEIETKAMDYQVNLAPSKASDLLSIRGVLVENNAIDIDQDALVCALIEDFNQALDALEQARKNEGKELHKTIENQIYNISILIQNARAILPARQEKITSAFTNALDKINAQDVDIDQERFAQELALLFVKQDVAEELDRLDAHVTAANDLMAQNQPVGRRLDFLTQEFNREANTLCSKAQYSPLSQIGIEMKTIIDQMREQVQNIE